MGVRIVHSVIKGVPATGARPAIELAAADLPGPPPASSRWSDHQYDRGTREVVAVARGDTLTLADGAWQLAANIARRHNLLHLELRIQEGDHWDFTLYRAGQLIADFSTSVRYFHGDDPTVPFPWKAGNLTAFADAWGIEPAAVEPYLIDWDTLPDKRFAVPGDKHPAGEWEQVYDFMRAIGAETPYGHPDRFAVTIPCWIGVFRPQPRWRRIIRRISVLLRGVYPDVPRRPASPRREHQGRKVHVTIEEV